MSSEAPAVTWPVLSTIERRLLGVLIEKAKTTPDAYPMSVNALITGSNQKSNREPLLNLDDLEIEDSLPQLQQKGLVLRISGSGRVIRWRHNLYDAWKVDKVELAILGELLLRGAQTEGELRSRASRMEPIDDLDALRARLKPLAGRRLVVYLAPEGRRGTTLTHGFHDAAELAALPRHAATGPSEDETPRPVPRPAASEPPDVLARIAALEAAVARLQAELTALQQALGQAPGAPSS